ncbi:MAG TPA: histidine kinase, partial [Flavitalea sp.]|nr:histidine kinase [Flavitalea sp.]
SPHFLFNMLNSAVSLARTQPQKVEPTLIRLSGLLRYMLYDSEDKKVPLNLEIEYLESYIELQKMRFDQLIKIEFDKEGVLFGYSIEPMLLIPFVENAFKHGLGIATDAFISISLKEENSVLYFHVKNRYSSQPKVQHDKYSGIGLANVRKRLDLLHNGNYHLVVNKTSEWFEINLKIPLQ